MKDLKEAYKTIEADHFAPKMEISFIDGDKRSTLCYEKEITFWRDPKMNLIIILRTAPLSGCSPRGTAY